MTHAIEFVVEHPTRGANAREHPMAHAHRVDKERNALALKWRTLLAEGSAGLLEAAKILRRPRGLSRDQLKLAKEHGVDLRVEQPITRPLLPLVVHLTRISAGKLDPFDNLPHALKGMVDEIAWQLGVDDRLEQLVKYQSHQERGPRGYHAVRVRIEPRPREGR